MGAPHVLAFPYEQAGKQAVMVMPPQQPEPGVAEMTEQNCPDAQPELLTHWATDGQLFETSTHCIVPSVVGRQTQFGFDDVQPELELLQKSTVQVEAGGGGGPGGGGGDAASQRQVFVFSTCPVGHVTHCPPQHVWPLPQHVLLQQF